jgi:small GTP-binding protein
MIPFARESALKIVLAGPHNAGKTAFLRKMLRTNDPLDSIPTIGADFFCKEIPVNNKPHKVHIWDTAGQETYASITGPYFRNASGVLLFFDLSDRNSFDSLGYWLTLIADNTNVMPRILLVGNKCDLIQRETSDREIQEFCQIKDLPRIQASALTGQNVDESLCMLVEMVINAQAPPDAITIEPLEEAPPKECC